ncbi:ferredoxin [Persephonella sp.]
MKVKVSVDEDLCTACALCYDELPEVYEDRGDGIAKVKDDVGGDGAVIEGEIAEKASEISEECPSGALVTEVIEE